VGVMVVVSVAIGRTVIVVPVVVVIVAGVLFHAVVVMVTEHRGFIILRFHLHGMIFVSYVNMFM